MSGIVMKKQKSWGDKFSLFGRRNQEASWKTRFLMLTNMGILEYRESKYERPSKVFSLEKMTLKFSQDDKTLFNKPFVFILEDPETSLELVYTVGNRIYYQQWCSALRDLQ